MLVSPKRQTMWMESQHCSKTTVNAPLQSQQAKKLLEDLRASCSSSNKSVQLEALKCWGTWINNQNEEDWKLNTVCFTSIRPLVTKKLQPLQKDVDVCKLRFSLMWALLGKVQDIMELEGPQYILEFFLQSCLNCLTSFAADEGEQITELIFQLLLALFSKEECINTSDREMFQPLSADIFKISNVFNRLAEKFLNVFAYWKKVQNKNVILKLWKCFLERCELSWEHVATPVWHKIFKLVGQICSEKSAPVKERLGILHGCATTLRSVLSSSKCLDYGNSLLTPCEALLKKLVELCRSECEEVYDGEMFVQGLEVSRGLSVESVAIGGYGLGISVLNLLDEFFLRSLYWGVWCGLVYCYESLLSNIDKNHLSKEEMNFYRKLRGVAINFDLDKPCLGEECRKEVERSIRLLNICPCVCLPTARRIETETWEKGSEIAEVWSRSLETGLVDHHFGQLVPKAACGVVSGRFSAWEKAKRSRPRVININFDFVNLILKTVNVSCAKSLLDGTFRFRCISFRISHPNIKPLDFSLSPKSPRKEPGTVKKTLRGNVSENVYKKSVTYPEETDGGVKSVPKTRSRKRAEEEEKRKEVENQKRKTRKSFETRVQEIVQKNKERKTEKNCKKCSATLLKEKRKKPDGNKADTPERKPKGQGKGEKLPKLEKYFKVIAKKSNCKKEETPKKRGKKKKEDGERKEEINWKQTSLVTMMIQEKETSKLGVRTRSKDKVVVDGRGKTKVMEDSPLAKLSPFKEVFHDHEYARMQLQDLRALERVVVNKEESEKKTRQVKVPEIEKGGGTKTCNKRKTKAREGMRKSQRLASENVAPEGEIDQMTEAETPGSSAVVENVSEGLRQVHSLVDSEGEGEKSEVDGSFKTEENNALTAESISEVERVPATGPDRGKSSSETGRIPEVGTAECQIAKVEEVSTRASEEEKANPGKVVNESNVLVNEVEEVAELDSTPRKDKKRFRILDSLKPSKKPKLEDSRENLALEVEKENLEEASKEEKSAKSSPKSLSGMISSRALRMIALVPESTRSQLHWETSSRVKVQKKVPNVDKNSRASKMLALLSENVVREAVEPEEIKMEEIFKSNGDVTANHLIKAPASSLKSPKTVKQRRSIRFDDTKNETLVYETDTPPSRVLEGRDARRRIDPLDLNSPVCSSPQFTTAK